MHVLHPGLGATLHSVVHTENTPPLWYVLEWAITRVLGTGAVALRLLSALAGIATVPVAWAIGRELAGRRAAMACAALVAVNPLFVWYSQEARAVRAVRAVRGRWRCSASCARCAERARRGRGWPRSRSAASLALLSHYFAVFLLAADGAVAAVGARAGAPCCAASVALALVGLALLPLISPRAATARSGSASGRSSSRLQAIPQYYLTGYSGAALGHGVELLVALPILAGLVIRRCGAGAAPRREERPRALMRWR